MRVAFRTDASLDIGTGHVMRCLTLADALRALGAHCCFVCRAHPGHLLEVIAGRGHETHALPAAEAEGFERGGEADPWTAHAEWLGSDMATDAEQTMAVLNDHLVDWLVVDHYAIEARWEQRLRKYCRRLLVIDDLADRLHDCDLLLDQNLGRRFSDYANRVAPGCKVLVGSMHALLRPEFEALRASSLARRDTPRLGHLLVAMGGVDKGNATGRTLKALQTCAMPHDTRITVVLGPHAPWVDQVRQQAMSLPWACQVLVNVHGMAALMADSDLAVGAAGTTAWERCCLGLPTLTVVLADNQRNGAAALQQAGAVRLLAEGAEFGADLCAAIADCSQPDTLRRMQLACSLITDGAGAARVANVMAAELVHA